MPFNSSVGIIRAKVEAVEGTAETLVSGDSFIANDISFSNGQVMNEENNLNESLSPTKQIAGGRIPTIGFSVNLKGASAAGMAPEWSTLMKGCKHSETIVASTSVEYKPISDSDVSLTIDFWKKDTASTGKTLVLSGCRGTFTTSFVNGQIVKLNFSFTGGDYTETDSAPAGASGLDNTTPHVFNGATFTLDAVAHKVNTFDYDAGVQVSPRDDITKSSGFISAIATGHKPTGSYDPEEVFLATYNILAKLKTNTTFALNLVMGSTAGNIITCTAPAVQHVSVEDGDRNNIRTHSAALQFNAGGTVGNDHFSIKIT